MGHRNVATQILPTARWTGIGIETEMAARGTGIETGMEIGIGMEIEIGIIEIQVEGAMTIDLETAIEVDMIEAEILWPPHLVVATVARRPAPRTVGGTCEEGMDLPMRRDQWCLLAREVSGFGQHCKITPTTPCCRANERNGRRVLQRQLRQASCLGIRNALSGKRRCAPACAN